MSLKPRLRGLEARVEWLQDWGELRKCAQQFRYLEAKDKIIAQAPELAMRLGWIPARPKPEARPQPPPPPPPPKAESPHPEAQARRAQARGAAPQGEVVPPPPPRAPPEPPPEPPTEPPTGPVVQPFEPIQSGLLRWRVRGPQDDWDDDEDSSDDEDYDVLADDL